MPPKKKFDSPPVESVEAKRVDRAAQRRSDRASTPPLMGRQNTPFGPVTLTDRGRGSGGMATTRKTDFKGATTNSATDMSYEQLLCLLIISL